MIKRHIVWEDNENRHQNWANFFQRIELHVRGKDVADIGHCWMTAKIVISDSEVTRYVVNWQSEYGFQFEEFDGYLSEAELERLRDLHTKLMVLDAYTEEHCEEPCDLKNLALSTLRSHANIIILQECE